MIDSFQRKNCVVVFSYAPWCPACRALESTWERLGQRSYELGMKFAKIDVTENAGWFTTVICVLKLFCGNL